MTLVCGSRVRNLARMDMSLFCVNESVIKRRMQDRRIYTLENRGHETSWFKMKIVAKQGHEHQDIPHQ